MRFYPPIPRSILPQRLVLGPQSVRLRAVRPGNLAPLGSTFGRLRFCFPQAGEFAEDCGDVRRVAGGDKLRIHEIWREFAASWRDGFKTVDASDALLAGMPELDELAAQAKGK